MTTFLIGIAILLVGGILYGKYCESQFEPDDRETPAIALMDGVDYVPMKTWKNSLIELLNIAGTGPILGPIQGILFGPIAFITIPVGCVLAGSAHDYFNGMISMREGGAQMPRLIKKYLGGKVYNVYNIMTWILMLLVGVVFVYTPGDLIVKEILGADTAFTNPIVWIVYAVIFIYYIASTLFPIDAIIGRIYPVFGAFLIISAFGIFVGILMDGGANLTNINQAPLFTGHPGGQPFVPIFFITVACGILSGFHGSQSCLISRTVSHEKEGRMTFYNMMLVEGFIAMCWAGGAMILFSRGTALDTTATLMVGIISREFLGSVGAIFAIIGVVVLPITSGDTAFRSLRLMVAEQFNIDQKPAKNRVILSSALFIPAIVILVISKMNPAGFNILWRYFAWTNQTIAIFALAMIAIYLYVRKKNFLIGLIPGMFYTFVVTSYILHAPIGLGLEERLGMDPTSYTLSFIIAAALTALYGWFAIHRAKTNKEEILHKAA